VVELPGINRKAHRPVKREPLQSALERQGAFFDGVFVPIGLPMLLGDSRTWLPAGFLHRNLLET
jgi:hypothetical protein